MDEAGVVPPASDPMAELKLMMINLGNRMDGVRSDFGEVRTDLGAEIRKGNEATLALKQRMDPNDATFATRVAEVVRNLPAGGFMDPPDTSGSTPPVLSAMGQSNFAKMYACLLYTSPSPRDS